MTLTIAPESATTPEALELIQGCDRALHAVYTPAQCAAPSADVLDATDTVFLVARENETPVGCVAVVTTSSTAVMNRLFTVPQMQGRGIGLALIKAAEQTAKDLGFSKLTLKTGEKLQAAVALYRQHGYVACQPFGGGDECLLYFEKDLKVSQ